ncbi:hypothetical protein DID80_02240 [Candidatus Marinamargulisbacteria bacterium SCGC AAA071-K20]|nr:hypothetical protein DID80_02240 [Candidatus Marinamargulisbacteria bacterium SCGC AAA071-K20]
MLKRFFITSLILTLPLFGQSSVTPDAIVTINAEPSVPTMSVVEPVVLSENLYIQIVSSPAPITVNAFHSSQVMYTTTTGNIFLVTSSNAHFYELKLPQQRFGWISKSFTAPYLGPALSQDLLDNMILIPPRVKRPPPKVKETPYRFGGQENFRYPRKARNQNIDLEVDGFYEIKLSGRNFGNAEGGLISPTDNRYETIVKDPIYSKIPKDVIRGDPKLDIRYHIKIDGQLDDDLSVHYDIEQEPDFPGKYDVRVKHKRKELTFYHFKADFNNGEFIQVNKALNGAMYTQQTDNSDLIIATGKQRSEPKKFETNGTGQTKIKLGNTSIFQDSLVVWVNNKKKREGVDFTANYFEGYIEFFEAPQREDYIEVVYEFTNPIEDFLPVLSRKNFTGAQYKWASQEQIIVTKQDEVASEKLWPTDNVQVQNLDTVESIFKEFIQEELPTVARLLSSSNMTNLPKEPAPIIVPKRYDLAHRHIVLGSDILSLNDAELIRNQDYFVDHNEGALTLKKPILVSDNLSVVYRYYRSTVSEQDLIGNNSPGPYKLQHQHLLDQTVSVSLDDTLLEETLDYLVDLDQGLLYFNYKIDYPRIITIEYEAIDITVVTQDSKQTPFNVGLTYMREFAKSQQEELELSVSSENHTVSGNIISGLKNPLIDTANIKIVVDSQELSTADYVITDAYKGIISIPKGGAEAIVTYKYRKSFRTKLIHQITLDYDRQGTEFNNDDEGGLVIRDVPVKYQGIDFIRYRGQGSAEEVYLESGVEFLADYRDNGQIIGITFLTKGDNNSASRLDNYPSAGDLFIVEYQYTPDDSLDPGNVNQNMIGITAGGQLSKTLRVDTEITAASHNFSKNREDGSITVQGTGTDNQDYSLGHSNVVEDSEQVFLNKILQTKDNDYIINYTRGTVKFRNLTPSSEDQIDVSYTYFDNSGQTEAGIQQDMKYATKLSSEYKNDHIKFTNTFKFIDKEFLPISPIKEAKGTLFYGTDFNWKINDIDNFNFSYDRRKNDKGGGGKDNNEKVYLVQDDVHTSAKIRLFDHFDTNSSARYNLQMEEAANTIGNQEAFKTDTLSYGYNNGIDFGPKIFRLNAKRTFSRGITDYIDGVSQNISDVETYAYKGNFAVNDVSYIGNFSFGPFYNNSWSKTRTWQDFKDTYSYRQTYGFASVLAPKPYLSSTWSTNFSEVRSQASETASENVNQSFNSNYGVDYTPFTWFQTSWKKTHRENESPLLGQKALIDDRIVFGIKRFSLFGALTSMGLQHNNFFLRPLDKSYLVYGMTRNNKLENDSKKEFDNNTNSYSLNGLQPHKSLTIPSITHSNQDSNIINTIENATTSENRTTQSTNKYNGSLQYNPNYPIVRLFKYNYTFDTNEYVQKAHNVSNISTSNIIEKKSPTFTRSQKLNFSPGSLMLRLPFNKRVNFGRFSSSLMENWSDKTNRTETQFIYIDDSVSTLNITDDSAFSKKYTLDVKYDPFNLFNTTSQYVTENVVLRRNVGSAKGVTFKEGKQHSFAAGYSPFRVIRFDGTLLRLRSTQYKSNELDIGTTDLRVAQLVSDFDVLESYLNSISFDKGIRSTFTPTGFFSFFSLVGGYSEKKIDEHQQTLSSDSSNEFFQQTGTSGAILRPLRGLNISYDVNAKRTKQNNSKYDRGYSGITKVTYQPIKTKHINVNIQYDQTHSWGFGLNVIQQANSEQGTGDSIKTEIIDRDDVVETGSLKISIDLPLTNSPFVQSFVIEGQGYLKKIWNKKDGDVPIGQKISYDISGMVIKGTLFF